MISKEFHETRRELYAGLLSERSIGILFSGYEKEDRGDQKFPFTPYANFYYLTGYEQPRAVYVVIKHDGTCRETLFIERPDETKMRWVGVFHTAEDVAAETGIAAVDYLENLSATLTAAIRRSHLEHLYIDLASWDDGIEVSLTQKFTAKFLKQHPFFQVHNTYEDMGLLRQVKTQEEIRLHEEACRVTKRGVLAILDTLRPGLCEYETEAEFDRILKAHNAQHAFPTIAASHKNACIMHYTRNDRKMEAGDMILFDLGAQWQYYAADVSRTYPVSGTFTEQQKQLYNVVLHGLDAALAKARPGQAKDELQKISKAAMAEELIRIGFIREPDEINRYYVHGSGHFIGLYTHDVGNDSALLEEDMVFTLEPGLYFDELNLGIRIEDTLVVTKTGCRVLTDSIPKTVEDIERYMAEARSKSVH
ncbi:MAG: aminopeptidase P N-terminal domain-containing protein [Lachnospiraceae bacterium]